MSRTRLIKPAFFKHAELYAAEVESGLPLRIAFAGLWTVTDREGRFRWKADLKPDILPYDPVDVLDVLVALERTGFVRSYVVDGKKYGFIPSFSEHQTFHKTERPTTLPPPPPHDGQPLVNGETPVSYTAVTGTVTGTVAGTGEQRVVGDSIVGVVMSEIAQYSLQITAAANRGAKEKWKSEPFVQGSSQSFTLAEELIKAGVPLPDAVQRIVDQIAACGLPRPPRSIRYFLPGALSPNTASGSSSSRPPRITNTERALRAVEGL